MYSLNVCNHLSFITTMVPIVSCVMVLSHRSLKHCHRTREKRKKIKTAAILCIYTDSHPALWVQPGVFQVTSLGYFKLALML